MSLEGNGGLLTTMPVSPAYGGNGGGFGGFGGDWGWIILLLLCGWGGGGFGGFGGGYGNMMLGYDFPWLLNGQNNINANTNNGFRDAMLNDGITSIRDGISGLSTQLCGCCSDMQMAVANGFAGVEQSANARQIANMQTAFGLQTQIAQNGSDNRLGIADLKYTVASEECATRATDTQNTQAILNAINDGFRAMSDQRYQDKIDAKNDEIAQLRQENLYARGQASQIAQDQRIVDGIYNRLATCPVDTTPVFGRSPIFTCAQNVAGSGCSCSGNAFYN